MKATGIVRRIDDLGRVVIPKEIRRTMRIREGDPLEIFTDKDGEVIFKKYSPIGELGAFAAHYAETLAKTTGKAVAITDNDIVIAVSGCPKKEILEQKVSESVEEFITNRENYILEHTEDTKHNLIANNPKYIISICSPIIAEGDAIGSVVFFSSETPQVMGEVESKLAQSGALFLGKQMEEWYKLFKILFSAGWHRGHPLLFLHLLFTFA